MLLRKKGMLLSDLKAGVTIEEDLESVVMEEDLESGVIEEDLESVVTGWVMFSLVILLLLEKIEAKIPFKCLLFITSAMQVLVAVVEWVVIKGDKVVVRWEEVVVKLEDEVREGDIVVGEVMKGGDDVTGWLIMGQDEMVGWLIMETDVGGVFDLPIKTGLLCPFITTSSSPPPTLSSSPPPTFSLSPPPPFSSSSSHNISLQHKSTPSLYKTAFFPPITFEFVSFMAMTGCFIFGTICLSIFFSTLIGSSVVTSLYFLHEFLMLMVMMVVVGDVVFGDKGVLLFVAQSDVALLFVTTPLFRCPMC